MLSFRLNWKIALFTFTMLPLLLTLGLWQLDREQEKIDLQAVFDSRIADAPVPLSAMDAGSDDLAYRKVEVRGQFDQSRYFLLDNRIHEGVVGYEVIMPFYPEQGEQEAVLINRGWVRAGSTRAELPEVGTPESSLTLTGTLYVPTAQPFMLGSEQANADGSWPQRVQTADVSWMAERLGASVYPYTVRLSENSPGLLQENWPLLNMKPEKHRAYAVQWFTMAAVLMMLFIYSCFRTQRDKNDETRTEK